MTYAESILGKKIQDLTIEDIEDFFKEQRVESMNLEFKSYNQLGKFKDKENVIKKSVCALSNSDGGILIWGAPIEVDLGNGIRSATGPLTPFEINLDKDKLVNKLSDSIVPNLTEFQVNLLTNREGKSVVIIQVEKSTQRPHQFENLYFVRLDGQTRVAPHYLIRALMLAKEFPILKGHVRLRSIEEDRGNISLYFRLVVLNSTEFINEKSFRFIVFANPGNIIIGANQYNHEYRSSPDILSKGMPHITNFRVNLKFADLPCSMTIILSFGGEKSPVKGSSYTYKFDSSLEVGHVERESRYLFAKRENKISSEVSNETDEDLIEGILKVS